MRPSSRTWGDGKVSTIAETLVSLFSKKLAPLFVGGTILGAVGGDLLGDTSRFGLDAIYPMFFLGLLIAEIKDRRTAAVALAGGAVAFLLVPVAPPGVPVLAAGVVALWGLRRRQGPA